MTVHYKHATTVGKEAASKGFKQLVSREPSAERIPLPSESNEWELVSVIPIVKQPGYIQYFWKCKITYGDNQVSQSR